MKLFTTKQIAELDQYTIKNEPIADIDLMERASLQISNWLIQEASTEQKLVFFAGPGNNGGDALAIARQMADFDYTCNVYLLDFGKGLKDSPKLNWQRLENQNKVSLFKMVSMDDFPVIEENDIVVDGLFGSGLTRPLSGLALEIVQQINQLLNVVVAIDIPSGLMGEDNSGNDPSGIIRSDYTLTFQFPKVSFLFPENEEFVGHWEVLPIGLHPEGIETIPSSCYLVDEEEMANRMPLRSKFDHKGSLGHALLIAGSYGKMGAALLASKACLRSGVGLLTSHVPHVGYGILQTAVPEAMASIDRHDNIFTEVPDLNPFAAVGIGPGLDQKHNSCKALCELLEKAEVPLVLDADALNILSKNKEWLEKLPEGSVLTPHPGEFRRLVGEVSSTFDAIQKQKAFAEKYNCMVVLKGAHTSIASPDGRVFFNSTGNPGMATAGSGDVLTGIILGLLAQGMPSLDAALLGVYLHGLAGDVAAQHRSEFGLIAGDLIEHIGDAFKRFV